jgi:hypothetical protein
LFVCFSLSLSVDNFIDCFTDSNSISFGLLSIHSQASALRFLQTFSLDLSTQSESFAIRSVKNAISVITPTAIRKPLARALKESDFPFNKSYGDSAVIGGDLLRCVPFSFLFISFPFLSFFFFLYRFVSIRICVFLSYPNSDSHSQALTSTSLHSWAPISIATTPISTTLLLLLPARLLCSLEMPPLLSRPWLFMERTCGSSFDSSISLACFHFSFSLLNCI